jgi:dipeptidyl-peptidase 9
LTKRRDFNHFFLFRAAGQTNASSDLKMATFVLNTKTKSLSDSKTVSLPGVDNLKSLFPTYEYFVRAQYVTFDSIIVQQLDRDQKTLLLTLVSLSGQFKPQVLCYENIAPHWAHVSDVLHFTNIEKSKSLKAGDVLEYLWTSQRSGFRHLYKLRSEIVGEVPFGIDGTKFTDEKSFLNDLLHCRPLQCIQLTSGNWEVSDKESWLDQENHLLYFIARKESPLETHLYVVDYEREDHDLSKLTTSGYSNGGIVFNANHSTFVTLQSSISVPPLGFLYRKQKSLTIQNSPQLPQFLRTANLIDNKNRNLELLNQNFADEHLPTFAKPELFSYQLKESGDVVYGLIFKPDFMQAGVKYPVLLEVYGGPGVQLVNNSYRSVRLLRRHLLASQGYVVCAFDCRGSYHRGVQFEGHLRESLGQVEVADHVEVLQYLASTTNYIDLNRVAVHGWSYGGYLSLLCLAQRPDIFKLCIAGAPVTNWKLYDTGYTERYLGLPQEKLAQYQAGSVLSHVPKLPWDVNRLLIMHGMMDENVHFQHSVELIQELIKAGKPYQLQVFPYERHSLRNQPAREHYLAYLLWYLNNYL